MTSNEPADVPVPHSVVAAYAAALEPFSQVVESVPDDAWDAPSPCEGWSTRDVLAHVVSSERGFLAEHGCDLGPEPDLAADPVAGWRRHVDRVRPLVDDPAVTGTTYESFFGPTDVGEVFEQFHVFDLLVHRWDLATGAGLRTTFTDDEMETVEARIESLGDNLHAEGVCGPAVPVGDDADRQTRLLAELGRTA